MQNHPIDHNLQKPLVIAHQGGEKLYPSNTMYAFNEASKLGVDMFELDIHITKDGHLVVIHDDSVDRTTDGQGNIRDLTLVEIQSFDAGHYWTEDGQNFPYRDMGIVIPTLEELFESHPTMPMVIDIKEKNQGIEQALCEMLRTHNKAADTIIGSFHAESLKTFRKLCPEVATSMHPAEIRNMVLLNYAFLGSLFRSDVRYAQVPMRASNIQIIRPSFLNLAAKKNILVQPWTINNPVEMQQLIDLGVHGIMTDRPDLLLELLDKQQND